MLSNEKATKKLNRLLTLYERFQGQLRGGELKSNLEKTKEFKEAKQLNKDLVEWQKENKFPTKSQGKKIHTIWLYQRMFEDNGLDIF